jgi:hypothetical protein
MKKPIKRYIFEVIVIFIGITMSFIFEEWRNSRQDDAKEQEYYELLLADIKTDSVNLNKLFDDLHFEQPRMDSVLTKKNYTDLERFAHDMCASFAFTQKQNFISSFETIRQSGDLKLLRSKDIINKCNYILAIQNRLNLTISAEYDTWANYRSYLNKEYPNMGLYCIRYQSRKTIKGQITTQDIGKFINDPQIMISYNDLLWMSQTIGFYSTEAKNELELLSTMIKKELNE